MPREKREIQKEDIMPLDVYIEKRRELRKNIVDYKKNRRVALGPYATFYFESYETMLAQVQEMLYIEKGGDEQLEDELSAYNPLIPNGKELTATLMFEIDNPISRAAFLGKEEDGRYVTQNRLDKMLNHEMNLLEKRISRDKNPDKFFFVYANTVATIDFVKKFKGHGWMGIKFQTDPKDDY